MYTKQPFFGMEVVIIGQTKQPRRHVENKIRALGGTIAATVQANTLVVISNIQEVWRANREMERAFTHRIQVITDEVLDEVIGDDPISVIVQNDISGYGRHVSFL